MHAKILRLLFWSMLVVYLPALALARSPLTDSTDVAIPSQEIEVENSVFISPLDSRVLLVSNIALSATTCASSFGYCGVTSWISTDAGKTWTDYSVLSPSRSDPACVIGRSGGTNGRYFINHLNPADVYDQGIHFDDILGSEWTHRLVHTDPTSGTDKNHLWIDNNPASSFANRLYCGFSRYWDSNSRIYLKYSENNGQSWVGRGGGQVPIEIDAGIIEGRDYRGVNIQTGPAPAGRVYACWTSRHLNGMIAVPERIGFRYSTDGGETWNSPTGGQFIEELTGFLSLPGKTMRTFMFPSMTVDQSTGHIYIVYADKPSTDAEVYLKKSTDGGLTWGAAIRVNQDAVGNGKDQWHPWITWDDCTGAIVVLFFDSRDFAGNDSVNTYMSVSYNGGSAWQEFKVSDVDWDGDAADGFAGDYVGLAAKDGIAFPVWSDDRPPRANDQFRPYISPVYLWAIEQSTVSHSYAVGPELELTVTANWNTNVAVTATDSLFLTSPTNAMYTGAATPSGRVVSHRVTKACPCETGDWHYSVKTSSGSNLDKSSMKTFKVTNCLD